MKVIILNAGIGKRLGTLTKDKPKCLVQITRDKTILDTQLDTLIKCSLREIIMLTGPFENQIKQHIHGNYPKLKVKYIQNPVYDKTNYIYSMYLLKDNIDDDVLLMHGDLIFSEEILKDLISSNHRDCIIVNKEIRPKKDFKALIIDEKIVQIGVNIFEPNAAFFPPLYKLSKEFLQIWLHQIEGFVNQNKVNCYAEDALNEILDELNLKPVYITDINCKEIDDKQDLEFVQHYFKTGKKE